MTWAAVSIDLPVAASVEVFAEDQRLRLEIDVHANAESLALLSDALRAAVIEVDAERADLAARRAES